MSGAAPDFGAVTFSGDDARAGQILAARWSIERLRRPAGPDLVWLGYAKPEIAVFDCLACGEGGAKQGVLRAFGRSFYICGACASHQAHPPPHLPHPAMPGFALRCRLEYAIDPGKLAAPAAAAVAGRSPGRLLDLGCGEGFLVDMAVRAAGWAAQGLDAGSLAAPGAGLLGCDVRQGGAQALAALAPPGRFDVVLGHGALGRSPEPLALLQAARARAAAGARWLLSADDAAGLYAAQDAATIARLAGVEQVLIPSRTGLAALLRRAGLSDLALTAGAGVLRAERGRHVAIPGVDEVAAAALLETYFARRLADPPPDGPARTGLLVRAFERAVSRGEWEPARRLAAVLAPALAAAGEAARNAAEADSIEKLLRAAPVCAPSLLFHAGMLALNGSGPSTQALLCFELSAALAQRCAALAPALMPDEAGRHWAARFHAGLVRRRMGEAQAAQAALEAVRDAAEADPVWAARAAAELGAMRAETARGAPAKRARKPARAGA